MKAKIKRVLLLVAHPDDEIIFCGGTLLIYSHCAWTVISATDDSRPSEFIDAMESLKKLGVNIVYYKTLGLKNIDQGAQISDLHKEKLIWEDVIRNQIFSPDLILTHNDRGEYGHAAHKLLSIATDSIFSNVWKFIYPKGEQPYKQNIKEVHLNRDILEKKTQIFKKYKSQQYIWEVLNNLMEYEFNKGPEIFTSDQQEFLD